jgi:hypothetical protein
MASDDNEEQQRQVRQRIARFMQADQGRKKQVSDAELQALRSAVDRLDHLLADGAKADLDALRSATARLDRLLAEIASGKDVAAEFRQPRTKKTKK